MQVSGLREIMELGFGKFSTNQWQRKVESNIAKD